MDYDPLFNNDFIGKTEIDIESRYFDQNWKSLSEKPIETRSLYHEEYFDCQGYITLWVDIFDKNDDIKRNNPVFIKPKPASVFEIRLIIWDSEGLENKDIYSSDTFYTINIDDKSESTDVHFNSFNGESSFNWRIVMPITYDENISMESDNNQAGKSSRDKILNILAYDYDIILKNDFIAQQTLDITKLVRESDIFDLPIKLDKEYFDDWMKSDNSLSANEIKEKIVFENDDTSKFWLRLKHGNNKVNIYLSSNYFTV